MLKQSERYDSKPQQFKVQTDKDETSTVTSLNF